MREASNSRPNKPWMAGHKFHKDSNTHLENTIYHVELVSPEKKRNRLSNFFWCIKLFKSFKYVYNYRWIRLGRGDEFNSIIDESLTDDRSCNSASASTIIANITKTDLTTFSCFWLSREPRRINNHSLTKTVFSSQLLAIRMPRRI